MNNTTDIFFNNGQLDWNALSTLTNTILVLALVIITWWYAREVKKQTEFMKIDRAVEEMEKLVDYKSNPGRKRFIAGLRCTNENFNFKFKPKGFGLLARGIGYYAPNSVIILLRYLVEKRIDDENFISNLSQAAKKCGEAYLTGDLSPRTQHQIALMIAFSVSEMGR